MSYSSEVLADSPLVYWRLGESSGTTAEDSSSNNVDGTYVATYTLGATGLLVGDADTAVTFGGGSVDVAAPSALTSATALTLEAWVKPSTVSGTAIVIGRSNLGGFSDANYQAYLFRNGSQWGFTVRAGGTVVDSVEPTATGAIGNTQHLVGTYDGTTQRLYVDGVEVASTAHAGPLASGGTQLLRVAAPNRSSFRFDGVIDEPAVYVSALSGARVAVHYATGSGSGPSAIEGALDVTLPAFAPVFSGSYTPPSVTGSLAATLPPLSVEFSGAFVADEPGGTLDVTLPPLVVEFSGTYTPGAVTGTLAATLPPLVAEFTGAFESGAITGTLDVTLPYLQPNFAGTYTGATPGDTDNAADGLIIDGTATWTWTPAISDLPAGFYPQQHAVDVAEAFSEVTIAGTTPSFTVTTKSEPRLRQRVVIAGADRSFFRGHQVTIDDYQLLSPFLYGPASITFPQILGPFEKPGEGDLAFLAKGARVRFESVNDETGTVVRVDWKGRIEKWNPQGRSLRIELGGEVRGPAATKFKPLPVIPFRRDAGQLIVRMLSGLGVKARPRFRGVETGYILGEPGGSYILQLLEEIHANAWTLDGDQYTTMPDANGIYRTALKDLTTCDATIYPDDAHVVVDLSSDVAEEPNRIYGTGTNPDGMRINNAIFAGAIEPDKVPAFPGVMSESSADPDGLAVLIKKLQVQGLMNAMESPGGFDDDVVDAVKQLQKKAGLPRNGIVDLATWKALWDIDITGRTVRGTRIEPLDQLDYTRKWNHSAGGGFTSRNDGYDPAAQIVDVHYDFGAKQRRNQMVRRAGAILAGVEEQWTGTIRINTGAVVAGDHTPGDPITSILRATEIKPGMNVKVPPLLGDRLLHVSGVSVTGREVTLVVDTRGRDTTGAIQAWQNNLESRRDPMRSWLREYRSSTSMRDTIGEWSEAGGLNDRRRHLVPGKWIVFDVFTGPIEGQIKWLRMNCGQGVEFSVLVFGRRVRDKWLNRLIPNPLSAAGEEKFRDRAVRRQLKEKVILYSAGIEDEPCGYWPDKKTTGASFVTGKWEDDMSWPYRTIPPLNSEIYGEGEDAPPEPLNRFPEPVLYVAVYANHHGYVRPGRIMWPQAEGGV